MGDQMRLREQAMPVIKTGKIGMTQIVVHAAHGLLDVHGIDHGLTTLSDNEAIRLRGLLNDVLASVMSVPTCHDWSRNVTQH
jgi:hypothetical protein